MTVVYYLRGEATFTGARAVPCFILCDLDSEKPISNLIPGDKVFCKDTGAYYKAIGESQLVEIGGGSGGPHALGGSLHTADTLINLNTKVSDAVLESTVGTQAKVDSHAGLPNAHHVAFTQSDHAALPNPHHSNSNDPTADQKAALDGTNGIPSGSNKYVTNSDPRNTDTRTPVAHDHAGNKLTQANTHESADTDVASTSLHHTLGAGANQAAAGDHSHAGGSITPDLHYSRCVGVSPVERWYSYPCLPIASTTGAITANRLYAFPFIVPKQITLDRIAVNVTTAGTGNARLGIYDDIACYPGTRISDAGEVSIASTGVKSITISQTLTAGLKWLALVSNGTPTLRAFAITGIIPILGWANTFPAAIPGVGFYQSFTYAALPNPFGTSGLTVINAAPIPAVFVRLSA